jgi:hypothetical protein
LGKNKEKIVRHPCLAENATGELRFRRKKVGKSGETLWAKNAMWGLRIQVWRKQLEKKKPCFGENAGTV